MAMLESDNEDLAPFPLGQWKRTAPAARLKKPDFDGRYQFLAHWPTCRVARVRSGWKHWSNMIWRARDGVEALIHAETLAANFPRRPSAWFWRAAAAPISAADDEKRRATLSSLAQRTPSDDPPAWARGSGLAALFVDLQRGAQLRHARENIFTPAPPAARWRDAAQAFPRRARLAKNHGPSPRLTRCV